MPNYNVHISGRDDPDNDEFSRPVEMTEEQAQALLKRLIALCTDDIIYDGFYVNQTGESASFTDVTQWLDELEAACG